MTAKLNLKVAEVAQIMDCAPNTVRNLIARGELRAIRVGRAVRVPVSELERLGVDVPATAREVA